VVEEDFVVWERAHGTRVEIPLKGRYIAGKQSVPEYLKATAIVNPHARITYRPPEGDDITFERATEDLPPKTKEIPPHPHGIEIGIVYGGDLPPDQPVEVLRFANRVPLLYQAGGCALTQSVGNVDWRRYGLEQRGGQGLPFGPAIILVHVCSTKVPYTSEAKEA